MTAVQQAGFTAVGSDWLCAGDITYDTATRVLASARVLPLPVSGSILCSGLNLIDSTAVAVLVAIKRRAAREQKPLRIVDPPPSLCALAQLYDIEDLLWAPSQTIQLSERAGINPP